MTIDFAHCILGKTWQETRGIMQSHGWKLMDISQPLPPVHSSEILTAEIMVPYVLS